MLLPVQVITHDDESMDALKATHVMQGIPKILTDVGVTHRQQIDVPNKVSQRCFFYGAIHRAERACSSLGMVEASGSVHLPASGTRSPGAAAKKQGLTCFSISKACPFGSRSSFLPNHITDVFCKRAYSRSLIESPSFSLQCFSLKMCPIFSPSSWALTSLSYVKVF